MSARRSALRAPSSFLGILLILGPLGAELSAQRTWVVDRRGGGDFTGLQAAFLAARDGDTVLIRSGFYGRASTKKALTLLGDGVPPRVLALTVTDLPASKSFAMKSLDVTDRFSLWNNKGRVHLERVSVPGAPSSPTRALGLDVRNCAHVTINAGLFVHRSPAILVDRSTVQLVNSTVIGQSAYVGATQRQASAPALRIESGRVQLAAALIVGGAGGFDSRGSLAPSEGVSFSGGTLSIDGDSLTRVFAGPASQFNSFAASAIDARAGRLRIAPAVTLRSTGTTRKVSGPVIPAFRGEPVLAAFSSGPGRGVATDAFGPAGSWSALFVSQPSSRVPTSLGDLWIDPRRAILLDVGRVGASGHRHLMVPVYPGLRRGTPLMFPGSQPGFLAASLDPRDRDSRLGQGAGQVLIGSSGRARRPAMAISCVSV